jgi:hypothetical protein
MCDTLGREPDETLFVYQATFQEPTTETLGPMLWTRRRSSNRRPHQICACDESGRCRSYMCARKFDLQAPPICPFEDEDETPCCLTRCLSHVGFLSVNPTKYLVFNGIQAHLHSGPVIA